MDEKISKDRVEQSRPMVFLGVAAAVVGLAAGMFSHWDKISARLGWDDTIRFEVCLRKTNDCADQNLATSRSFYNRAGQTVRFEATIREYGTEETVFCNHQHSAHLDPETESPEAHGREEITYFLGFINFGDGLSCTERFSFEFPTDRVSEDVWSEDEIRYSAEGIFTLSLMEFMGLVSFRFKEPTSE